LFILLRPLLDDAATALSTAEPFSSDCIDQHPMLPRWTNFPIVIVTVYIAFSNKQVVIIHWANARSLKD
jgi:hypothetical protein